MIITTRNQFGPFTYKYKSDFIEVQCMVGLTPILYIFFKVSSIFVETLDCVKYFVWVVFSLLIPPFIWNREICNLTWTWFWAKTLRLENTILPPSLGREIVFRKPLFSLVSCTSRMHAPPWPREKWLPRPQKFSRLPRPAPPAPGKDKAAPPQKYWETSPKRCGN